MKKTLLFVLAMCVAAMSFAGTGVEKNNLTKTGRTISGTLKDSKGEALGFANVFLHKASDSTFVKAVAADGDGKFLFEDVVDNKYFLKASFVGYVDFYTPTFVISGDNPNMVFPTLVLKEVGTELQAVTVVAKKPFIEQQIDKTVLNVENSIVGSGSTALEVLEKAPGVIVDRQNDQIRLRNKSGVLVMIDGKQNYMSATALAQYLNNLASDQIESIEIITNPSSKYEAAGNSGIINIKLKRNKMHGTNGTYTASAGTGLLPNSTNDLWRGSNSLNLTHKNAKWNLFGNASVGRSRWYSDNTILRTTRSESLVSKFDQYGQRSGGGIFYSARAGADYFINDKTSVGVMGDINLWDGKSKSDGHTDIYENSETITTRLNPLMNSKSNSNNFSGNFNLKHKFDTKGKEMTFDIDYAGYRSKDNQSFENRYLFMPDSNVTVFQRMSQPTNINIVSGKLDFVLPNVNKVKLEFGAKSGYVFTDNDFGFKTLTGGSWVNDQGKSNHFKYKELINAVYVNAGYVWGKWMFQGGLRGEHTHSDGHSLTTGEQNVRNYFNVFPTLFANQTINETNSIRYSYSKRIDRPNYQQLNPFLFFVDPYTYQKGNPFLRPQYTDSYEVTYTLKHQYSLALSYSDTRNMMGQVLEQDDETRVAYQTERNLSRMRNYSANFSVPVTVAKWWNMHNSFSLYYNKFEDGNVGGAAFNQGRVAYNIYTGNTFTLKNNWSAEASMWFNSPQLFGIIDITSPQYAINAGVQKTFWERKGRLKLNVSDIFLTSFTKAEVMHGNMDMKVTNRWNARRIGLTFTYNFGNQNVRSARKSTAGEDLKKRVGGNEG